MLLATSLRMKRTTPATTAPRTSTTPARSAAPVAPPRYRSSDWCWRPTRLAIYHRDGFCCAYCGQKLTTGKGTRGRVRPGREATLDHVIPVDRGGTNAATNLVTACLTCNAQKGHQTGAAFIDGMLYAADRKAATARVARTELALDRAEGRRLAKAGR